VPLSGFALMLEPTNGQGGDKNAGGGVPKGNRIWEKGGGKKFMPRISKGSSPGIESKSERESWGKGGGGGAG